MPLRTLNIWVLLFALLSACSTSPPLSKLKFDAVILAFGDSLTYGVGADTAQSYPARLAELSKRKVINAGVPGEVTAEGSLRLAGLLDEHKPDLLILFHGANDLLGQMDAHAAAGNIRKMIRAARERAIPVVLVGVPLPQLPITRSAPLYSDIAAEFDLPLEDTVLARIVSHPDLTADDGLHPNARGYQELAEAVFALLQKSGAL